MTAEGQTAADSNDDTPVKSPKRAFGQAFWMCNVIEMWERLAYFGIRSVVPIYIMQATEPGGLHLTAMHKGWIYGWWAIFQSWLPMVTGGFADRYGYKRILFYAIMANVVGYLMMAFMHSYYGFFAGILVLATGTAFFKPALQGTIAQNLTKQTSSLGWGIFYWVVNVGAVCAPILATIILGRPHSAEGWRNLFIASAAFTSVNLLLLFSFKDVASGADKTLRFVVVFGQTIENVWFYWFRGGKTCPKRLTIGLVLVVAGVAVFVFQPLASMGWTQPAAGWFSCLLGVWFLTWLRGGKFTWQLRLPAFLLIMSCFWMMMYQLWDLHPNFIEDWVDSSSVAAYVPFDGWKEYGDRGLMRVPQQILLNLNAFLIVLLVLPISWLVRRMRTLSAMLIGMSVATGGVLIAGLTGNGWVLLLGVVFFSLGEMLTGPKKNQYLGLIAPAGKKALYLGYVNIPIGIGVGIGSIVAGHVYGNFGEKASLALKHLGANTQLIARAARSADWSDSLERVPQLLNIDRDGALDVAAEEMNSTPAEAATFLRAAFRYDRGQITNLGLCYLALHPDSAESVRGNLAKELNNLEGDERAHQDAKLLGDGKTSIDQIGVARYVHLLPAALGIHRSEMMGALRDRVNQGLSPEQTKQDAEIVETLWSRFGADPDTLDNLALEFLAQGTDRLESAAASLTFDNPAEDFERQLGVGRTKSFAALSAAMGADENAIEQALGERRGPRTDPDDRAYTYLIGMPHHRFLAIARKDWKKNVDVLKEMIDSDAKARKVITETLGAAPGSTTDGQIDYGLLAGNQELILEALTEKDWSLTPSQAGAVLGLNPFEARALAAAELNRSPVATTKLLWETYTPQYYVWLPFAMVGILATIALGIFGQMAKRWSDMNA